jgi:hypothetical protein
MTEPARPGHGIPARRRQEGVTSGEAETTRHTARNIVLATGSDSLVPPIPGLLWPPTVRRPSGRGFAAASFISNAIPLSMYMGFPCEFPLAIVIIECLANAV